MQRYRLNRAIREGKDLQETGLSRTLRSGRLKHRWLRCRLVELRDDDLGQSFGKFFIFAWSQLTNVSSHHGYSI